MGWLSKIKDKIVDDIIPNEVKSGSAAKKAIRNLIPNELADIAVKAAPFVAPFQPGIAAAMRGIGRFDQRGSISDALKQGAATYGFGKAANYGLSKIPTGSGGSLLNTGTNVGTKIAENRGIKTLMNMKDNVKETTGGIYDGIKEKAKEFGVDKYFLGEDGEFQMGDITKFLGDPNKTVPMTMLATYIKEKFFPGETQDNPYNVALGKRGDDVAGYLRQYGEFDPTRNPNTDPFSDAEKEQFVTENIQEYRNLPEYAMGGRVNYGLGSFFSSPTASTVVNPTGGGNGEVDPEVILDIFKAKFGGGEDLGALTSEFTATPTSGGGQDITTEDVMDVITSKFGGMGIMGGSGLSGMLPGLMGKTLREINFDSDEDEDKEAREAAAYGGRMGFSEGLSAKGRYENYYIDPETGELKKKPKFELKAEPFYPKDFDDIEYDRKPFYKDMATGGRMGYKYGSDDPYDVDAVFKRYERKLLENKGYDPSSPTKYGKDVDSGIRTLQDILSVLFKDGYAMGGRVNYAFGTKPGVVDQAAGIEGLDININPEGIKELDLRETGGFIPPVGVKEKADDIPAMLSNNEFVFTADAVREAGDGDVDKGAERMYSMMKNLENGGRV